jgi:hypothetical protein
MMILSFTFCTFSNNVCYKQPEEKIQRNEIWGIRGSENGFSSSNATIRKLPSRRDEHNRKM